MNNTGQEIRNNLYEFYDHLSFRCGIPSEKEDHWSAIIHVPGDWPRIIYRITPQITEPEPSLLFSQKVKSGLYPEIAIADDKNTQKTDPFLRSQGFYPYVGWKGMALDNLQEITAPVLPKETEIVKLQSPENIDQWIKIVTLQLISPARMELTLIERLVADDDVDLLMLRYRGEGVSTILVFRSATSTGLYMIVTDPSAQRKGFARLLIQQVIFWESQKSGNPIVLHATPKGEAVYSKLGFQPYNQFFLYRYLNSPT